MEASLVDRPWLVELPADSAAALAPLRLRGGLRVCVVGDAVWLRGETLDDPLRQRLACLPASNRFWLSERGELTPWDRLTPVGYLPQGAWAPLNQWGEAALPRAAWPGAPPGPARLRLLRGGAEQACKALLTSADHWRSYMLAAPHARFDGLAFAASAAGEVIVRGERIPAIPGERFTDKQGIFIPAGYCWTPAIDARAVREAFALAEGETALWRASDHWERLPADAWVKTTRSAVRQSFTE